MAADVFKALADESRRHLLDKLRARDGLTLSELCSELDMSRQAVSKHLAILEQANLVVCVQRGRNKHHYLNPIPLQDIVDRWVAPYRRRQAKALTWLKRELEKKDE
jgi:predicted transcriptional regulator